jgi:hypothetical protein
VVLELTSNRAQSLDAMCIELDADGLSRYGKRFELAANPLPQTLSVLAGGRSQMQVLAYGLSHGQEALRARRVVPFQHGAVEKLPFPVDACVPAPTAAKFQPAAMSGGAFMTGRAALLPAPTGDLVIAPDGTLLTASSSGLQPAPGSVAGGASDLIVADLDGDCRADLVVLGAMPQLFLHGANGSFTAATLPVTTQLVAGASGDVDGDGLPDLVLVGGTEAHVLVNDGSAHFREVGGFDVAPTDATSIALGDLDGDGHLDALVGQGAAAADVTRVYLNDARGTGHFVFSSGSFPPRMEKTNAVALADFDGDGHLDAMTAHTGAPVRLYLNRGAAFFEDRTFTLLPSTMNADVETLTIADLNRDCLPDALIAPVAGPPVLWISAGGGKLVAGEMLTGPVLGGAADDVTGDGLPDLLLYGPSGLTLEVQQ